MGKNDQVQSNSNKLLIFISACYSLAIKLALKIEGASDYLKRKKNIDKATYMLTASVLIWAIFYVDDAFIARSPSLLKIANFITSIFPWLETMKNNWGQLAQKQVFLQSLFIPLSFIILLPQSLRYWDIRLNDRCYRKTDCKKLLAGVIIPIVFILIIIYADTNIPSQYSSFRRRHEFFMFNGLVSPISACIWGAGFTTFFFLFLFYFIYLFIYCGHKLGLRKKF